VYVLRPRSQAAIKPTENKRSNMRIRDKAVLVKLSLGAPGNTRKDPTITSEVKTKHSLGDKAGRWLKQLYPDEALKPVTVIGGEARTFHYANSLPWADEGWRILPTANHLAYTDKLRELRAKYLETAETHFLAKLNDWEDWAREQHNGTFDPADYLTADKLRRKFAFATEFSPIPDGEDFRDNAQVADEERAAMSAQVVDRVSAAVKAAECDLWERLTTPLSAIVERLSDPEHKFKDTLVGNVADIIRLVPALNLTGNAKLEEFRREIEAAGLHGLNPQVLRDSKPDRKAAADKAAAILAKMQGYAA